MANRAQQTSGLFGPGLRPVVTAALLLAGILFFLPLLTLGSNPLYQQETAEGDTPAGEATFPLTGPSPPPPPGTRAGRYASSWTTDRWWN